MHQPTEGTKTKCLHLQGKCSLHNNAPIAPLKSTFLIWQGPPVRVPELIFVPDGASSAATSLHSSFVTPIVFQTKKPWLAPGPIVTIDVGISLNIYRRIGLYVWPTRIAT